MSRRARARPEGHVVVGPRFIAEAITGGTVNELLYERGHEQLVERARAEGLRVRQVKRDRLDDASKGARHQGVVALGPPFPFAAPSRFDDLESPLLIAFDELKDPQNFGAILRSALAFGADGALVTKHRSASVTPAVVRASAGASERLPIAQVTNLSQALLRAQDLGRDVVGLAMGGTDTVDKLGPAPTGRILVIGSEGPGLRRLVRERCTRLAAIPQLAGFDSLNASVAAAIALYESRKAIAAASA
ncbi:MAG: 23S rRNA (guanosine(2251)-2'-O)-methyltransferase RlmB [Myxococcota bacterium]